jgi:hypothetical protein
MQGGFFVCQVKVFFYFFGSCFLAPVLRVKFQLRFPRHPQRLRGSWGQGI